MRYNYSLKKISDGKHKYVVITPEGKKIKFGAHGYKDYIIYSKIDPKNANIKKKAYIARHEVNENFKDLNKKGTWARWILWNKKTISESIGSMEKRFGINIVLY